MGGMIQGGAEWLVGIDGLEYIALPLRARIVSGDSWEVFQDVVACNCIGAVKSFAGGVRILSLGREESDTYQKPASPPPSPSPAQTSPAQDGVYPASTVRKIVSHYRSTPAFLLIVLPPAVPSILSHRLQSLPSTVQHRQEAHS